MANFLYNGVKLPALPEYDKSIYPYAYIVDASVMAEDLPSDFTGHILFLSSCRAEANDGGAIQQEIKVGDKNHMLYSTASSWVTLIEAVEESSYANLIRPADAQDAFFWANTDVLNSNGLVYFAASTPTRVDSKLKISVGGASGDNYALYNGMPLPNIDSVWTDKETYPYAFIIAFATSPYNGSGQFVASSVPIHNTVLNGQKCMVASEHGNAIMSMFDFSTGCKWGTPEVIPIEANTNLILTDLVAWSSYDILNTADGTVYRPTSTPVGMCELEFDASNGYLETIEDWECYKVFDETPTVEELQKACLVANGSVFAFVGMEDVVVEDDGSITIMDGMMFVVPEGSSANEDLSAGVWLPYDMVNEDGITNIVLAYPASSDGGEVTANTATAVFTCTDLENTEPTDSICAWVYKKSDGLNTTIPPTWTSEMFAAPSYSTSHTFTGLTPNTEYEVYGCIFVNGEATDHNAVATFTTLEGGGEEEPVITETSGDGFALYNGVKLPSIDSVWADKEAYPYSYLTSWTLEFEGVTYSGHSLFLYPVPVVNGQKPSTAFTFQQYGSMDGSGWILENEVTVSPSSTVTPSNVVWTSHDILNTDNTVYFAASDPIPLNGMTVIEWNGGTAGLTNSGTGLYKITDDVFASNQVIGGVFVQNVSSKLTAIPITTAKVSAYENGISIDGKIYTSPANTLMPEAGTYFVKLVGDYVSLFAYPNAADLKPVYKRVGGVWVKKTAYERQNGEWVLISTAT